MGYIIVCLILMMVLATLIKPGSKFLTICMMCIFVIMIAGTYDSYDYYQYCIMYSRASEGLTRTISGSWLLSEFMRVGSLLGLDYDGFRLIVTIIECVIIQTTVKRYCKYTALVWALFIIFPGWWLTTLFRHSIALTIMIFSIRYLIEENRLNWIKYLLCVVLAGTFHSAFWFFALLVIIKFYKIKYIIMAGVASIVIVFVSMHISLINNLLIFLNVENDIIGSFQQATPSIIGLATTIVYNLPLLLPGLISKWLVDDKLRLGTRVCFDNHVNSSILFLNFYKILATFLFCISVGLITSISARLFHFYSFYFILVAVKSMEKFSDNIVHRFSLAAMMFCISMLLTVFTCLQTNTLFENIIKAIFETNVIFSF